MGSKLLKFSGIILSSLFIGGFFLWDQVDILPSFLLPLKDDPLQLYLVPGLITVLNILTLVFPRFFEPLLKTLWYQIWNKKFLLLTILAVIYLALDYNVLLPFEFSAFLKYLLIFAFVHQLLIPFEAFKKLVGNFDYQLPSWIKDFSPKDVKRFFFYIIQNFKSHNKAYLSVLAFLLVSVGSYLLYLNWPQTIDVSKSEKLKDKKMTFKVWEPSLTSYESDGAGSYKKKIDNVILHFSSPVAPLELIGKKISEATPRINPDLPGEWKWENDQSLVFTPKKDWEYGKEYKVELHKLELPKHFIFEKSYQSFTIAPLKVTSKSGELYIDPRDPKIIKGIYTLEFNYPIDKNSIQDKIFVKQVDYKFNKNKKQVAESKKLTTSLVFDELGYKVHIHTENVVIPKNSGQIILNVSQGIPTLEKSVETDFQVESKISLPGMKDFFKVEDLGLKLVENEEGIPEFITHTSFSIGIRPQDFSKYFEVFELPRKKVLPSLTRQNETVEIINWSANSSRIPELTSEDLTPVKFKLQESPDTYPKTFVTSLEVTPTFYYLLKIKKGLKSASDYDLTEDYTTVVRAKRFPEKLKLMNKGNILSLSGTKKINIFGLNKKGYKIEVGMLIKNQIQHLISQTRGDYKNPSFNSHYFDENNITHKETATFKFSSYKQNKPLYGTFDFSKYLNKVFKGQPTEGIFFLKLLDDTNYRRVLDERLIIVSDLGVIVKKTREGAKHFFVQSLKNGSAISGAKLDLISANGLIQKSILTDSNGHAILSESNLKNNNDQERVIGTVISKGQDKIFLKKEDYNRRLNMSRFMTGGVFTRDGENSLKAYLFTDRGIYRPGEDVRIGTIVKEKTFKKELKGIPVYLTVTNSRGKKIHKIDNSLPTSGLNSFEFFVGENAPTGEYQANLYTYIIKNGYRREIHLGGTTFKVEEFLPDRLKIQTKFTSSPELAWTNTKGLKAVITLKNLFGFPAVGHDVRGLMKVTNKSLYFSKYREFQFDNPTKNFDAYTEDLSEQKTNEQGEVTFNLPLEKFANKIFQLQVFTEGFEKEGGRSVNGARSILVSPYEELIGLKATDDYSFIKRNQKKFIEYVAIDNKLNQVATKKFSLAFYERKVLNVLTKRPNGTFGYESIVKDVLLSKENIAFNKKYPLRHQLDTQKAGDYKMVIMSSNEEVFSTFFYSVVGKRDLARSLSRDVELKIKLENQDIVPGDTITFELRSAYVGAGLITIETDQVETHKWFRQNSKTTLHSIKVPSNIEGNAYLNVTLLRSSQSDDIYTSPLSYGVVPFTLSKDARKNPITLDVKGVHKPGEKISIRYKTKRRGDIILYAVDEGILQFAKYQTPKPLDFFFKKRALEVVTYQLLDLLLPEYEQVRRNLAPGGGFGAVSQQLNPFKRKKKKPVAFWSGVIKSGPQTQSWSFDIPDYFNGNLKIFAVSVSPSRIGVEKGESFVRADLIITPTMATYISPGDKFKIPLTIFNNTPQDNGDKPITLEIKPTSGLSVTDKNQTKQTKQIKRESDAPFACQIEALDELGNQEVKFLASSGNYQNSITESLSLRPSHPHINFYNFGVAKPGKIKIEEGTPYYKEFYEGDFTVGLIPTSLLKPFLHVLSQNPYGCTEQLLSKAYPLLAQWDVIKDEGEKQEMASYIQKTITMIYGRRMASGSVSLYPSGRRGGSFLDLYSLEFLLDAKEAGLFVRKDFLSSLLKTVKSNLSSYPTLYRSYGVYLITKAQEVPGAHLIDLEEDLKSTLKKNKAKLTSTEKNSLLFLATVYQILGDNKKALSAIKGIDFFKNDHPYYDYYYNRAVRQMRMVFLLSEFFPDIIKDAPAEFFVNFVNENKRLYTTLTTTETIRAFVALGKRMKAVTKGKFKVFGFSKDKTGKEKREQLKPRISGDDSYELQRGTYKIEIENGGNFPLYYSFLKAGFPRKGAEDIKKGLEVTKEILNLEGNSISEVTIGDEVQVVLSFRTTKEEDKSNLALVDLFPGGFENVLSEDGKPKLVDGVAPDFTDVREDRIISYGGAIGKTTKISYRLKAINVGEFTIPPTKLEDMYDREVIAIGKSSRIKVIDKK